MRQILAEYSASLTELQHDPTALLVAAAGAPIAILHHNTPQAYLIPAETFEQLMEILDDHELAQLVEARRGQKAHALEVRLDEL